MNIKAILLAAGFGTRLRPITNITPKCLLPINGRPLIEYWLRALYDAGIQDILMNLHHLASVMEEWLGQSAFAGRVRTVYEDPILGTGGTLLQNRDFVGNEPVMLIHADNLCLADFPAYLRAHESRPAATEITMMTFTTPTPATCGIVAINRDGVVHAFYEKVANPPGNLANAAVYILEPGIIGFLAGLKKSFIDFSTEVLPHFMGKINTFHNAIYHRDIGTTESFLTAQWECPDTTDTTTNPVDGNNSWRIFCEKNDGMFVKKMLNGLAEALHMEVIDLRENKKYSSVRPIGEAGEQRGKIFVLSTETDFTPLSRCLENSGLQKDDQILFLPAVHACFSSKKILAEQGLKSIAVCASAAP
ncbi:MAG: nucleotidyltransferase family protein [Syntrophales bacterium]